MFGFVIYFQIPLVKSFVATGVTYLIATFGDILGALILGMFFNLNEPEIVYFILLLEIYLSLLLFYLFLFFRCLEKSL